MCVLGLFVVCFNCCLLYLFISRWSLFVFFFFVWWCLFVVCCLLFGVRRLMLVVCCSSCEVRRLLCVVCRLLYVVC